MFKFFRKIRQELLAENKFGQYLLYAMGEVVLVVIGILIALSIDTWNQVRLERKEEITILENIRREILQNTGQTENIVTTRMKGKLDGLRLAKQYAEGRLEVTDTLEFLRSVTFGAVFGGGYRPGVANYFNELVSTGNLELICNDSLRNAIADYYSRIDTYEERSKVHASKFLNFTNSLRPFYSDNPGYISEYDQKEMMEAFRSEAFRRHTDTELSYTYQIQGYIRNFNRKGEEVNQMIARELGAL